MISASDGFDTLITIAKHKQNSARCGLDLRAIHRQHGTDMKGAIRHLAQNVSLESRHLIVLIETARIKHGAIDMSVALHTELHSGLLLLERLLQRLIDGRFERKVATSVLASVLQPIPLHKLRAGDTAVFA